jgi:hypothetical protein
LTLDRAADFADTTLLAVPATLWLLVACATLWLLATFATLWLLPALKWRACFTIVTDLCDTVRVLFMARECLFDFALLALTLVEGADLSVVVAAAAGLVSVAAGVWARTGAASIEAATRAMATLRSMDLPFGEVARVLCVREGGSVDRLTTDLGAIMRPPR